MTSNLNPQFLSRYRTVSRAAGGIVFAIGFLVLAGWLFDLPALKSILPGLATMKANTALAFTMAGASLVLATRGDKNQRIDLLAKACAGGVLLMGLLTFSEYIFKWDLGIDQLLFKDTLTAASAHPGRMSLVTALNFSLLGSALLLLDSRPYRRLVEVLGITALLISVLALIGYAYGIPSLYQFFPYASVAIHTALAFSILCIGILFARPEQGLMQILSSDDLGGVTARRITPAALVIPFILGWLFLTGERMGYYDSTLRLVLFATSNVVIFAILIWWNASLLQRAEAERGQAETALNLTEQRSRALLENSWDAIALFGADGSILYGSPSTSQILGYALDEFVGRNAFELIHPEDQALVTERMTLSLQQPGVHVPIYSRVRHKNGEWRWLEGVFTNLLHEPSVQAIVNNYHDFTERRRAEEALRASEERFRLIVEAAPSAMIAVNRDGKIDLVNAKAQELFGYGQEELLGRPVEMLVPERFRTRHPNYRQSFVAKPSRRAMGAGRNLFGLHKDGHEVPIEIGLTPYESSEGPFTLALIVDITERSQSEKKIAYQAYLLENVNDAVIGSDENAIIRFWNQGAERMFGWKAEEALGRSGREILRSEFIHTDRETVFKMLAEHGRWKGEATLHHKAGSQVITEVSSITLRDDNGLITGYVSVHRDIAERKQAEADLYKSEELLRLGYDTAKLGIWQNNLVTGMVQFDERARAQYGFDADNVPLADVIARVHPEDVDRLGQEIATTTDPASDGRYGTEYRVIHLDGSVHWLAVQARVYFEGEGNSRHPVTGFGTSQDITERKQAEEEIRELNEELNERVVERTAALSQANNLLQMMLDHMPDQIYFKDAQSRFIRNSRSQAEALGLSDPADAVGKSDFDFFPHAQLSFEKEQEIMRSGKPLVDEEERVVWPNGRETWVSTTKVPLPDPTGQIIGTFGISRDITDRKRTEAALQKARLELQAANQELEAFSYSVSHDLRSPLRSIDGFSQALLEDYADQLPAEGQDHLKRVRAATQRMGQLIDDLLNLSKVTRASMKLIPVDLSGLAQGIAAELQRTQPERRVTFKITPNLKARGDPGLLQAVLENLLNNAWKFTAKREQAEIEFRSRPENDETVYFIRDNGAGFDMAYVGKLFGAFQRLHAMTDFSGTGIGLATVQRVIHRHGGRIWAEGAVNRGATFFFTLPALERAKPEVPSQEKDSLAQRAREII